MKQVKIISTYCEEHFTTLANKVLKAREEGFVKAFTPHQETGEVTDTAIIMTKGIELTIKDTIEIYYDFTEGDVGEVELESGEMVEVVY